jgi:hypothetical protein
MGYTEIVKLLVKYGDPKNNNSYAYQRAVENGHKEVAGILAPLSDPEIVKKSKKTKESIRRVRSGKVLRESVNKKTYEKQKLRNKQDEKQNSEISKMKHAVLRVIESATEATSEFDEFGYNDDPDTDIEGGETEEYIAELIADCLADHQDEVSRIESFESAGVMTKNVGIVLSMTSGKRFQIQIVEA